MTANTDIDYFTTPQLEQRLELAHHLIDFSSQLILVAGPTGSGKSRFLQELADRARENWRVVHFSGSRFGEADQLLSHLALQFNLLDDPDAPPVQIYTKLEAYLRDCVEAELIPVALIDDADSLSPDAISLVEHLANPHRGSAPLRVLIAGGEALSVSVSAHQRGNSAAIVHTIDIPRFNELQSEAYMHHRFPDLAASKVLDSRTVADMHAESDGVAGQLELLLGEPGLVAQPGIDIGLEHGTLGGAVDQTGSTTGTGAGTLNSKLIQRAIGFVVALAVVLSLWSWLRPGEPQNPGSVSVPLALPAPSQVPALEAGADPLLPLSGEPLPVAGTATSTQLSLPPPQPIGELGKDAATESAIIKDAGTELVTELANDVEEELGSAAEPLVEPLLEETTQVHTPTSETAEAALPVTPQVPVTAEEPVPVTTPKPNEVIAALEPVSPAIATPDIPPTAMPEPHPVEQVKQSDWLLKQHPDHHVLQLFGSHDKNATMDFLAARRLGGKAAWFIATREGRDWYVVVYGLYPNRDKAAQAISDLAPDLAANGPFPRSIRSIRVAARPR